MVPDEDGSKRFLVDFEKKTIDAVLAKKEEAKQKTDETFTNEEVLSEPYPEAKGPGEEWYWLVFDICLLLLVIVWRKC